MGGYFVVGFGISVFTFVQLSAQVAKRISDSHLRTGFYYVIALPLKILFEQDVVSVQFLEVIGQLFRFKLPGVDEGMRRGDATVIGAT